VHVCKGSSSVALISLDADAYLMNNITVKPFVRALFLHEIVLSRKCEATYMLVMWESFGARLL
jgi:hypothetical protein